MLLGIVTGAVLVVAAACGSSYEDSEVPAPAPSSSSSSGGGDATTSPTLPVIPAASNDGPCDGAEVPVADGIFVSKARGNDENAGSAVSPVTSVARALALAKGDPHREIYLAQGTYEEVAALVVATRDLRVSGGWREDPLRWTRDCAPGRRMKTIVYVSGTPALGDAFVAGSGGAGKVVLDGLSLATVSRISTTLAAIAIHLKGEGPAWELTDVTLVADRGRNGVTPATPNGAVGPCLPCSTGTTGAGGKVGGATAPTFTPDGFVPGDGAAGTAGTPGAPGTAPPAAPTALAFAGGCATVKEPSCPSKTPHKTVSSGAGTCGCGGGAGAGGPGGEGGGASIALYVSGTRQVRASFTYMKTMGGGDGAPGAPGGGGAPGTTGTAGAPLTYDARQCANVAGGTSTDACVNGAAASKTLAGGPGGGPGGAGGGGGAGGPGAGGASVGLVRIGATVDLGAAISFEIGPAGKGAEGAEAGQKAERLDL